MKYRWLIIDGNYLLHVIFAVVQGNRTLDEFLSIFIASFFNQIKSITERFDYYFVAVAWDHPNGSAKRKEILPGYKEGRKRKYGFKEAMIAAKEGLEHLNIVQVESPEGEGDDVIATMCRQFSNCCIWSADKDFLQLVRLRTHLYKVTSKMLITMSNIIQLELEKVSGFDPKQWGDYLKIKGDAVDNLKGLPGIGAIKAGRILHASRDFVDIIIDGSAQDIADLKNKMNAKGGDLLKLTKLAIKEREKLIQAKKIVDLYTVKLHYTRPKPSKKNFSQFLLKHGQQHMSEQLYVE